MARVVPGSRPACVTAGRTILCYAVLGSDKRNTEEEADMTAQVVLLVIGGIAVVATVGWWVAQAAYRYWHQKLLNEVMEALELGVRLRGACS
jgi:uncharacterized membrane protein YsdA (DUF1294 family)